MDESINQSIYNILLVYLFHSISVMLSWTNISKRSITCFFLSISPPSTTAQCDIVLCVAQCNCKWKIRSSHGTLNVIRFSSHNLFLSIRFGERKRPQILETVNYNAALFYSFSSPSIRDHKIDLFTSKSIIIAKL